MVSLNSGSDIFEQDALARQSSVTNDHSISRNLLCILRESQVVKIEGKF